MLGGFANDLLVFVLLLLPGFIFNNTVARSRPTVERSAFEETAVIVLTGLAFSSLAALVIAIVSHFAPSPFLDLSKWLLDDCAIESRCTGYRAANWHKAVFTLSLIASGGSVLALLVARKSAGARAQATVELFAGNSVNTTTPVLWDVLHPQALLDDRENVDMWVSVRTDAAIFTGVVEMVDVLDVAARPMIVLQTPVSVEVLDGAKPDLSAGCISQAETSNIVIPIDEVRWMTAMAIDARIEAEAEAPDSA